ncbi:MAG: glycosyltransferase family 9 protein [Pyrinomonadaceae bacterium]
MRILFVKLSSIGDVIHTLPALAAVKRALPNAEIEWVVEKKAAELLRGNSLLKRLIEIDTKELRQLKIPTRTIKLASAQLENLRSNEFDVAIDFQGNFKSAAVMGLSRAKNRFGFESSELRESASRFIAGEPVPVKPHKNIVLKNIELAEGALRKVLNDKNFSLSRNIEFPIFVEETDRMKAESFASAAGGRFAILNPAGGWETKLWRAERFGELADRLAEELEITTIVTTAPNETAIANAVVKATREAKIFSVTPSLKSFYELAKLATVYVGGDTAPTHLAIAAGCPIVGIFGPTEWWRNGSTNPNDICVERNDIDCRENCHRRKCGNWICMDISVEEVFDAVSKRINENLRKT